jgi:simple sugar transport system permease protein
MAGTFLGPECPSLLMLAAMALAAFAAGAFWGLIPGILKSRFGTSEILTSLMLVYIAVHWNNFFIYS